MISNHRKTIGRPLGLAAALAGLVFLSACVSSPMTWLQGGETLMPQYRTAAHEVDYKTLGLSAPPMGLRWYRVDRAYVLANRTTGLIIKSVPVPPPTS